MKDVNEKIAGFFKNAFDDMAESARVQHEADKANFEAARLKSRSNRERIRNRPLRDFAEAETRKRTAREQLRRELEARDAVTGKISDGREGFKVPPSWFPGTNGRAN